MYRRVAQVVAFVIAGGVVGALVGNSPSSPQEHDIVVSARRYAYDPERIHVNQGDTIRLRLYSKDVIHGFYLEGHDIDATIHPHERTFEVAHPSSGKPTETVEEITFTVGRRGKFRYRCSHTCGSMHPFMTGEMVVHPNTPLHAGLGLMLGLFSGMLFALRNSLTGSAEGDTGEARVDVGGDDSA